MKKFFPLLSILVPTIFFSACTKITSTDIGGDLIPGIDGVNTKEMYLDVSSKNMKDTSTSIGISTINALGHVDDPLFGKTDASINVQIKPDFFPVTFPVGKDSLYIDSVVMVLAYNGVWGDTLQNQALSVYEIEQDAVLKDLRPDTIFSTNYVFPRGRNLTYNNTPVNIDITKLNDSLTLGRSEGTVTNQMRLRLTNEYGSELLHNYDTAGVYKSDSLYDIRFKGYQIVPSAQGNALLRINLLDTGTKIAIYYRYTFRDSAGKQDTAVRYWHTSSYTCGSSNYIQHNRSGYPVNQFLQPSADSTNDSLIFVDANPGIYSRVRIPGLSTLTNRIIHRAELVMEQVPYTNDQYYAPANLFLTPYTPTGGSTPRFALPYDVSISSGTVVNQFAFGCIPFKKKDPLTGQDIYAYSFDISRYVQGIITRGNPVYDLILYAPVNDYVYLDQSSVYQIYTGTSAGPLNYPSCGRVRLGGGSNTNYKMRLHIVYSEVQ